MKIWAIAFISGVFLSLFFSAAFCEEKPPEWMKGLEPPTVTAAPAAAPEPQPQKFIDVPESHWAAASVYDLVKMGISQGYPDGTFLGSRNITRYETAMLMSKMIDYRSMRSKRSLEAKQKDFNENYAPKLKAELDDIKKEIEKKNEPEVPRPEFGFFEAKIKAANLIDLGSPTSKEALVGPRVDWRLKMTFSGNITSFLWAEANFDTMDAGWGGSIPRSLVTDLIDVKAKVKSYYGFDMFFTAGPGPIVHTGEAGGPFPSDDGTAFLRPWNSFGIEGLYSGFNYLLSYSGINLSSFGQPGVSRYNMVIGYDLDEDSTLFGLSDISTDIDYRVKEEPTSPDNCKEKISVSFKPKWGFELNAAAGASSVARSDQNFYYQLGIVFKDVLKKGLLAQLCGTRIGADFINAPDHFADESTLGLDYFDKLLYIPGGGGNAGIKITNKVTDNLVLSAKGVVVADNKLSYGEDSPGTYTTFEIGLDFLTDTYSSLGFLYRVHHEPSFAAMPTSDMFAVNAKYEF